MAQDYDHVVEPVLAPQALGAGPVGQAHGLVVGRIVRGVAPAVGRVDRDAGEPCGGGGRAVRTP